MMFPAESRKAAGQPRKREVFLHPGVNLWISLLLSSAAPRYVGPLPITGSWAGG